MEHLAHGALPPADDPDADPTPPPRSPAPRTPPPESSAHESQAPRSQASGQNTATSLPPHANFCNTLGILHYNVVEQNWWSRHHGTPKGNFATPGKTKTITIPYPARNSYYGEIIQALKNHERQYWFIATLINALYLIQITIAATATVLGSVGVATKTTQARTTAITVLTAVVTVITGVLAFFKSRGQPNRVRQLRNDLRKVYDYVRFMEMAFSYPSTTNVSVEDALKEVKRLYDLARSNAETNYPDTWSTSADTRKTQIFIHPGAHPVGEVSPSGRVSGLAARVV